MAAATKSMRFEILRRDNFTCRYCGAKAPDVKLAVDAVVPEALGGSHRDPGNLVAACADCNNGKAATPLEAPFVADVQQDAVAWARARKRATAKMRASLRRRQTYVDDFMFCWRLWQSDGAPLPLDANWEQSLSLWYDLGVPIDIIEESVRFTMRAPGVANRWRYFCARAWRHARDLESLTVLELPARQAA